MKLRFASLLLALALPLSAQDPVAAETEAMFYKAFYLEKGQRDFAGAMDLYEKFLAKAPEHKLAKDAATQQFNLLDKTGKTKERDAFKAKYEKLLGNAATAPAGGGAGAGAGERGRGEGAGPGGPGGGERGARGEGGRPDAAARIAELEKELAKAKEEKNDARVKELEGQLERARTGGRGQGGPGAGGGRRGGLMAALGSNKKIADMTPEETTQLKEALGNSTRMIDMMKENGQEEQAKKLETNIDSLKKALEANKTEDAQKALDAIRESMPRRGGRGAGGEGGNRGGGGAGGGGGGGNTGGGGNGGGGNGGGGGR
jgi:hypothetical protein